MNESRLKVEIKVIARQASESDFYLPKSGEAMYGKQYYELEERGHFSGPHIFTLEAMRYPFWQFREYIEQGRIYIPVGVDNHDFRFNN